MRQALAHVAIVVRDYDEALDYYCNTLGFECIEDSAQPEQQKRWVVVAPQGWRDYGGCAILLARAATEKQADFIGDQCGGRVFLFLATDDFERDHARYSERGVDWVREPKDADYGKVAVFRDLYGNLWDLVQFSSSHPFAIKS